MIRLIPIVILVVIILAILLRRKQTPPPLVEIRSLEEQDKRRPALEEGQSAAELPSGSAESISEKEEDR